MARRLNGRERTIVSRDECQGGCGRTGRRHEAAIENFALK